MELISNPYPHIIHKNYMSAIDFGRCKSSIDFEEMKNYCDDPSVHEHDNGQKGNYSMPTDLTKNAEWMFDYFSNDRVFETITTALYGRSLTPDHSYINLHWDCADTSLGIHNDQKKYRWLVTGQLYVQGDPSDGVILQDRKLNEICQVPLEPNLFYAMATSMYSWHHVKNIKQDKVSVLVRFGKKQINTVTNRDDSKDYAIIVKNDGHYDGHYSKLGMRMANITEAWLFNQGYHNIHMSEWRNDSSLEVLEKYCHKHYAKTIVIPSGYLGESDLLSNTSDLEKVVITDKNIKQLADIVFQKTQSDNLFARGEKKLQDFDPLKNFSDTKEKII